MTMLKTAAFVFAVTTASGVALAQPTVNPADPDPSAHPTDNPGAPEPIPTPPPSHDGDPDSAYPRIVKFAPPTDDPLTSLGFTMMAGGGFESFTSDELRNSTGVAGNWNVRASIGTKRMMSFEANYFGSQQNIDALGLQNDATLVGNGLQGNLRVNLARRAMVQPFVYGGLAWRNYSLRTSGQNLSDVEDRDNVLEVPMGVGLGYRFAGLVLDMRGEFRAVSDSDLIRASSDDSPAMHRWGMNANIGYEF